MTLFTKRNAILLLLHGIALCGCAETAMPAGPTAPAAREAAYMECRAPRPEMCTQQYDPVCASRDTGIRCVTTPCDSSKWVPYANACMACADNKVYGYRAGDCDGVDAES